MEWGRRTAHTDMAQRPLRGSGVGGDPFGLAATPYPWRRGRPVTVAWRMGSSSLARNAHTAARPKQGRPLCGRPEIRTGLPWQGWAARGQPFCRATRPPPYAVCKGRWEPPFVPPLLKAGGDPFGASIRSRERAPAAGPSRRRAPQPSAPSSCGPGLVQSAPAQYTKDPKWVQK